MCASTRRPVGAGPDPRAHTTASSEKCRPTAMGAGSVRNTTTTVSDSTRALPSPSALPQSSAADTVTAPANAATTTDKHMTKQTTFRARRLTAEAASVSNTRTSAGAGGAAAEKGPADGPLSAAAPGTGEGGAQDSL